MAQFRGYGQFCPVSMAAEVISERWTLLILRELLYGHTRFSELKRGVPLMSPTLLSQRLKQLECAHLIERRQSAKGVGSEYHLTAAGLQLGPIVEAIGSWGLRWLQRDVPKRNLDPSLLMWDMRRGVNPAGALEGQRTVVEIRLPEQIAAKRYWWLVFEDGAADLCLEDPGFEVDLSIETDLRTLTDVWMGQLGLDEALRTETLRLEGSREQRAAFRRWFQLNKLARMPQWPWPELAGRVAA